MSVCEARISGEGLTQTSSDDDHAQKEKFDPPLTTQTLLVPITNLFLSC